MNIVQLVYYHHRQKNYCSCFIKCNELLVTKSNDYIQTIFFFIYKPSYLEKYEFLSSGQEGKYVPSKIIKKEERFNDF